MAVIADPGSGLQEREVLAAIFIAQNRKPDLCESLFLPLTLLLHGLGEVAKGLVPLRGAGGPLDSGAVQLEPYPPSSGIVALIEACHEHLRQKNEQTKKPKKRVCLTCLTP
jgi:hypothetical protein